MKVNELINKMGLFLADIPYNEKYTEKQRSDISGTTKRSEYNPSFLSWKSDPVWDKENPPLNEAYVLSKFEDEFMQYNSNDARNRSNDTMLDMMIFNMLPNKEQRDLTESSGYPEGKYGLIQSYLEHDSDIDGEKKQASNALMATLLHDKEGITSLLMPEVKVRPYSKTSKGYNINPMKIK
jgi:hypothetical protein